MRTLIASLQLLANFIAAILCAPFIVVKAIGQRVIEDAEYAWLLLPLACALIGGCLGAWFALGLLS